MNAGQYEGILGRLDAILAKMPAAPVADVKPLVTHHLDGTVTKTMPPSNAGCDSVAGLHNHARCQMADPPHTGVACRRTLGAVLQVLDGWVQGAKENHEAMGHRGENTGSECWRTFAPSDIRNMINDAATELGLATFAAPTDPEEDKAL